MLPQYTFNPSIRESKAGGSLRLRPAWSLYSEIQAAQWDLVFKTMTVRNAGPLDYIPLPSSPALAIRHLPAVCVYDLSCLRFHNKGDWVVKKIWQLTSGGKKIDKVLVSGIISNVLILKRRNSQVSITWLYSELCSYSYYFTYIKYLKNK